MLILTRYRDKNHSEAARKTAPFSSVRCNAWVGCADGVTVQGAVLLCLHALKHRIHHVVKRSSCINFVSRHAPEDWLDIVL